MYDDIFDMAMDQQLLTALNIKTTDYSKLPLWAELQAIPESAIRTLEEQLSAKNLLRFEHLYSEPIGYHFIKIFLEIEHSIVMSLRLFSVSIHSEPKF